MNINIGLKSVATKAATATMVPTPLYMHIYIIYNYMYTSVITVLYSGFKAVTENCSIFRIPSLLDQVITMEIHVLPHSYLNIK